VSPLRNDGYREFWDAAFLRALGFDKLADRLRDWWPAGGPHWDALALLEFPDGGPGVLLAEGKSYPAEMRDEKGSAAKALRSIEKIHAALNETREWLDAQAPLEHWLSPYYQTANRLATLYWLHRGLEGKAWLVHLCFLDDPTHTAPQMHSTLHQWENAFDAADAHLGLHRPVPNYAHVFLPGLPRPNINPAS
jgi:hypothetical protein